jgi:septum formation protein
MASFNNLYRLILASSSPYRQALLSRLRLPFEVIVPNIDEAPHPHELPQATALRLAEQKARSIAHNLEMTESNFPLHEKKTAPSVIIIGSDQVATLGNIQIGKPGNHQRALAQLQMMRGKQVVFHSALCVYQTWQSSCPAIQVENVQTTVTFRDLPDAELDAYLRIEQPYDCAGSAKNEGLGIALIERIESSDPTALTGLPLITLTSMLRHIGVKFFTQGCSY